MLFSKRYWKDLQILDFVFHHFKHIPTYQISEGFCYKLLGSVIIVNSESCLILFFCIYQYFHILQDDMQWVDLHFSLVLLLFKPGSTVWFGKSSFLVGFVTVTNPAVRHGLVYLLDVHHHSQRYFCLHVRLFLWFKVRN